MNTLERTLPKHRKGIKKHFTARRKFITVEDAQLCYNAAVSRLLNVNHWYEVSMLDKGGTQVMSSSLKMLRRKVRLGDYVRIGVPAPDNPDGEGYDWVQVRNLKFATGRHKEQCLLTLQPCAMPGGSSTAHFFSDSASSNFLITRDGRMVTAEYYGHNEMPNTDTNSIKEAVRDFAVAAGAMLGFSDAMWKPMTEGLLMDGTKLRAQKAAKEQE